MKSKYIHFKLTGKNPKTSIYDVLTNQGNYPLGKIKWYAPWRQYTFITAAVQTVFTKACMNDINEFITELMEKRK